MSRADRRWRPSDADRERYAAAVSQAFAEGRIDATDMESRTALVYEATSIADLDALVEDMPAPAAPVVQQAGPAAGRRMPVVVVTALVGLLVVVGALAGLFSATTNESVSGAGPAPAGVPVVEEQPPPDVPADLPEIATERLDLFTLDGLTQLHEALAAAGITEIHSMYLRPGDASLEVRAETEQRALDDVEYVGGLVMPREPLRDLDDSQPDEAVFLPLSAVPPQTLLDLIERTPAAAESPDAVVAYINLERDTSPAIVDGEVVHDYRIVANVYLDGSSVTYVKWDVAAQTVMAVH